MLCVLKGTLSASGRPAGVVARPGAHDGADPEVLVMTDRGSFYSLLGACGHSGLRLGAALSLFETGEAPGNPLRPYRPLEEGPPYSCPAWDSWSRSIFFRAGHAIFRLTSDNVVELVAGDPREEGDPEDEDDEETAGAGPANEDVLFSYPSHLVSDGKGSIYCSVLGEPDNSVLRLQLPAVWRAPEDEPAADGAAAEGGGPQRVRVSTLLSEQGCGDGSLAYSHSDGCLVMANDTALFRLLLGAGGERGPAPVLLAGRPGEQGERDGRCSRARFKGPTSIAADGDGNIFITEDRGARRVSNTSAVRRVTPDGSVTTLASALTGRFHTQPFVLPNGYLAICDGDSKSLLVLDLGLKPLSLLPAPAAPAAPAAPPRRTLHADMGALLTQPDGTADLTLVVAGRRFLAHRAILAARCDYFKQRLALGGFADGAAAELDLPDADPAAFELLLRFVYTGAVDIPASLAPSVAELADRLLLPELCADAQAVVLSGVSAATVVGSLLWAERLGGSFSGLVSSLKAWAVEHYEEVRGSGSLRRLMAESPELMEDMMAHALTKRPRAQ
ncbi:hypothetical protein HYH03_009320 [Edaphochlamys debaryana]|uniref:BTB domain-containing protein n=1 Tax=Edaphochlamys debaryana TaxID=47281 RepID=A0A836BXW6_9CHLO|nr:hypothetical protein HYH03_009320 [Edaphochlamys debaryana]|eukprot:KAG2492372.1 hypothetical protein HYH03_009320 [Edaphochlamys debaryana]